LEQNAAFYPGWLGQVLMLIELGEYREADVWADKALELFPEHPELYALKAVACARDGRAKKAMGYSDTSISKDNITAQVWLSRAELLMKRGSRIAENCISKAVGLAEDDRAIIRLEAGRLLCENGLYSAALPYLQDAADALPKSALVWYELGVCQARLGRRQAAVSLEQCLNLRPGWREAERELEKVSGGGFWGRLFGR
jgi:tetratricopeptide (TPR) repeat protein